MGIDRKNHWSFCGDIEGWRLIGKWETWILIVQMRESRKNDSNKKRTR